MDSKNCQHCNNAFVRQTTGTKKCARSTWVNRKFCSLSCRAKALSDGANNPNWKGGIPSCIDCGNKLAVRNHLGRICTRCKPCAYAAMKGENHPRWRGGVTPLRTKIWKSQEYQAWRNSVFARDGYTCQQCGDARGRNLEADHILPFAFFPSLRLDISNGRTLCKECHKQTETWGYGAVRFAKQYGLQ